MNKGINETKSWFFGKIIKINKPFANLTKKRREKTQMNKIRDEKWDITTNLYSKKLENLEEMDKFLDAVLPKLNQDDT
jgi:hypothetical protein